MTEATLFLPGLSPIGGKEITATFDGGQLSSDGGVLILREIEKRLGIATMLSRHVPNARDPGRIVHTYADMIRAKQSSQKWPSRFYEKTPRKQRNLSGLSLGKQRKPA